MKLWIQRMKCLLLSIIPIQQFRRYLRKQGRSAKYFSAITDMWSSSAMETYFSYSIHFIDDWVLKNQCLQTLFVPKDHNAVNLSVILRETLTQWKLQAHKQVCMTTNMGSNIVCATTVRLMWTHLTMFWAQPAFSCCQFYKR